MNYFKNILCTYVPDNMLFIAFVYMYQDVVFREIISYILQDIYSSCCNYSNDEKEEAMQSLLMRITGDNVAKKVFILYKI